MNDSDLQPEIPFPSIDLEQIANPVPLILEAPEFKLAKEYFLNAPSFKRALVSANSQALLYSLVRNMRAEHVVEIGTFYASTSEAICRALAANGRGTLHTIDPYGQERVPGVIAEWPLALRKHVKYYPTNSMGFFEEAERRQIRPDIVFVDGNHDYEFALFDVLCSARRLQPGGFVAVDNISQSGPFLAAQDFLAVHSDWIECPVTDNKPDRKKAFDGSRTRIPNSDFSILRAPRTPRLYGRPFTFGELPWFNPKVNGVKIDLGQPVVDGNLYVQLVLRGFGGEVQTETVKSAEIDITVDQAGSTIEVAVEISTLPDLVRYAVEPWLTWDGKEPLPLKGAPKPF